MSAKQRITVVDNLTFRYSCDEPTRFLADMIVRQLSSVSVQDESEMLVPFGWAVFRLSRKDRIVDIESQDYTRDPIQCWTSDISGSIAVISLQEWIPEKLGLSGGLFPCRFSDKVICWRGALNESQNYMHRQEPKAGDSGWYIAPFGAPFPSPSDLEAFHAYRLMEMRQVMIEYLCLPVDYIVSLDGDTVVDVVNEKNVNLLGLKGMDHSS